MPIEITLGNVKYETLLTPGDGSCLFHALAIAIFASYSRQGNEGKVAFVQRMRQMAGKQLETDYETLYGGQLAEQSAFVPEYSYEAILRDILDVNKAVGTGILELLCDTFDVDIYITYVVGSPVKRLVLYPSYKEEMRYCIKGRDSVVLFFKKGTNSTEDHYEPIAIPGKGCLYRPDHDLINYLKTT